MISSETPDHLQSCSHGREPFMRVAVSTGVQQTWIQPLRCSVSVRCLPAAHTEVGLCHATESSFGVIMLLSGTALVKEKPLPCLCQTLSVPWQQMWWKTRVEQQHAGCCCRSWLLRYFIIFVYVFFKNTSNQICCLNPLDLFHISIWERNLWEGMHPPPKNLRGDLANLLYITFKDKQSDFYHQLSFSLASI